MTREAEAQADLDVATYIHTHIQAQVDLRLCRAAALFLHVATSLLRLHHSRGFLGQVLSKPVEPVVDALR